MYDDETGAIIRATVQRFRAIATEHARNEEDLQRLYRQVDDLTSRQGELQQLANRCYSTADLFGFNLAAELATATPEANQATPDDVRAMAELAPPDGEQQRAPTVKEFILERARLAYPQPVRAAGLRRSFEEATNKIVHEKTFGMSLYRLSLDGAMIRKGTADWFFVPEEQRIALPAPEDGSKNDLF